MNPWFIVYHSEYVTTWGHTAIQCLKWGHFCDIELQPVRSVLTRGI